MGKWKVFVRRDDLGSDAVEKMGQDKYEVDMWDGPVPMPREEFLKRVKGMHY